MVAEPFNHLSTMDTIQGVDVSWMTRTPSLPLQKDHAVQQQQQHVRGSTPPPSEHLSDHHDVNAHANGQAKEVSTATTKPIPIRPNNTRSNSDIRTSPNGNGQKPLTMSPRRNSWLSSISSKFSSSQTSPQIQPSPSPPPAVTHPTPDAASPRPAASVPAKNATVPPESKPINDAPPPPTKQSNFLQSALRRLSSSGGSLSSGGRGGQHGLCERRVLNVDPHRERCAISELDQSKLRRVAFCVDVEIASAPRYSDEPAEEKKEKKEKKEKRKYSEKGEGEALKRQTAPQTEPKPDKAPNGGPKSSLDSIPEVTPKEAVDATTETKPEESTDVKDVSKKKEKKKRSEEERKARKEKKRRLAEANGSVPVELIRQDSDSSVETGSPGSGTPKVQATPTIDPIRIYRRCCQLRETPILKKITEQLAAATASGMTQPGVVRVLDLSGYWLQLPDLVTLGDYLAVVPVKELLMENCGLTDEGVRVILAGLLAAKSPEFNARRRVKGRKDGEVPQGGFVERVVLKNNNKIGPDGWRHISLFINMCRSLKSMDLSQVPFPQPVQPTQSSPPSGHIHIHHHKQACATPHTEICHILSKAIGDRLGGQDMELLNLAETGITTEQLAVLVDGVIKSGLRRLGLSGNGITAEGLTHVARYIKEGKCEGLDLGGNDLTDRLGVIAEALDEKNILIALSLAGCNLTPDSLWALFPALAKLNNFRFIDLSQNQALFSRNPSALSLFRRYLPKMPILRRIHLQDVSMTPEQAIALAEILPEAPNLAHISLMENPQVAALANAKDEAGQEEAAALYASLMAAVRVSRTIVCVDIEVPSPESSEVVKALAKQVVAYCLWNMEREPLAEVNLMDPSPPTASQKDVEVPDVLLHLVGHVEGVAANHDDDEPAPDDDYMIGGTGVVKALGICLSNRANDSRAPSRDGPRKSMDAGSGASTPISRVSSGKAKIMSKNLLDSARKIRARLQPALAKEAKSGGDRNNYNRLLFLDQTLEGMIKRFEEEFPETRLPSAVISALADSQKESEQAEAFDSQKMSESLDNERTIVDGGSDEEVVIYPTLSRHNSDVSLASKALSQEEGRMHRFSQAFRRDILIEPDTEDQENGILATIGPAQLRLLRAMVDDLGGEELKKKVETEGDEVIVDEIKNEASLLREKLKSGDPEGWQRFVEAQKAAQRNSKIPSSQLQGSAIE